MNKDERISDEIYSVIDELTREYPDLSYKVEENGKNLVGMVIDSPTGNTCLQIALWMCRKDLSVTFGPWHTHVNHDKRISEDEYVSETIVDVVRAIIRDEFVVCEDIGGEHPGFKSRLDLRYKEAILEEITSDYSPGHIRISSWGGSQDGEYNVSNPEDIVDADTST